MQQIKHKGSLTFSDCFDVYNSFTGYNMFEHTQNETRTKKKTFRDRLMDPTRGLPVIIVGSNAGRVVVHRTEVTPRVLRAVYNLPKTTKSDDVLLRMIEACLGAVTKGWEKELVVCVASGALTDNQLHKLLGLRNDRRRLAASRVLSFLALQEDVRSDATSIANSRIASRLASLRERVTMKEALLDSHSSLLDPRRIQWLQMDLAAAQNNLASLLDGSVKRCEVKAMELVKASLVRCKPSSATQTNSAEMQRFVAMQLGGSDAVTAESRRKSGQLQVDPARAQRMQGPVGVCSSVHSLTDASHRQGPLYI